MSFLQMRVKGYLLLMICVLISSIFYCIIGDPKPSLQNIVTETNRQFQQPLKRLKEVVGPAVADSSNYYLGSNDEQSDHELNEKYLKALGFVENPRLYPADIWRNATLPILVTAVKTGQVDEAINFLKAAQFNLPETTVIVYDLGLDDSDVDLVSNSCAK